MRYTLRQAAPSDHPTVWELIHDTIRWLRSIGSDQWDTWRTWRGPDGKVDRAIAAGHVWLLYDGDDPIATITVEPFGDTDFWTPTELTQPALYVSKLAVRRTHAGKELGAALLAWVRDLAWRRGDRWVRLDAWRSNVALHDYYRERGWQYVRDVDTSHRSSGTLFQLPPEPMPPTVAELIEEMPSSV